MSPRTIKRVATTPDLRRGQQPPPTTRKFSNLDLKASNAQIPNTIRVMEPPTPGNAFSRSSSRLATPIATPGNSFSFSYSDNARIPSGNAFAPLPSDTSIITPSRNAFLPLSATIGTHTNALNGTTTPEPQPSRLLSPKDIPLPASEDDELLDDPSPSMPLSKCSSSEDDSSGRKGSNSDGSHYSKNSYKYQIEGTYTCSYCGLIQAPSDEPSVIHTHCPHAYCPSCLSDLLDPAVDIPRVIPSCEICTPYIKAVLQIRQEDREECMREEFWEDVEAVRKQIGKEGLEEHRREELLDEMLEEGEYEGSDYDEEDGYFQQCGTSLYADGTELSGSTTEEDADSVDDYLEMRYPEHTIKEQYSPVQSEIRTGRDTPTPESYIDHLNQSSEHGSETSTTSHESNAATIPFPEYHDIDHTITKLIAANQNQTEHYFHPNPRLSTSTSLGSSSLASTQDSSYDPFEYEGVPSRVPTEASLIPSGNSFYLQRNDNIPNLVPFASDISANALTGQDNHNRSETSTPKVARITTAYSIYGTLSQEEEPFESLSTPPATSTPTRISNLTQSPQARTPTLRDRRLQKYAKAQVTYAQNKLKAGFLADIDIVAARAEGLKGQMLAVRSVSPPVRPARPSRKGDISFDASALKSDSPKTPVGGMVRVNTGTDWSKPWRPPVYEGGRVREGFEDGDSLVVEVGIV